MITLEQHLAAHWPTVHTHEGLHWSHMYQCKCGWMPPQDDPDPIESIHAAHVAATWREAQAAVIDRANSMLSTIDYARSARVSPAYPDGTYRRMVADLLEAVGVTA